MNASLPDGGPSVPAANLARAGGWLRHHGLADVVPTPLLAARLAVRRRTRLAGHLLLGLFIIAVSLIYVHDRRGAALVGFVPYGRRSLLVLTAVVVLLVLAQSLLQWWVRHTDRRLGATLPRRVTHPVRLGWQTVLGRPRAGVAAAAVAAVVVLAIRALAVPEALARYAAVVLLIAVCGVAATMLVQLRHVLTHAVVADDEVALRVDIIMRVDDARDVAAPTVLWALPVASVLDIALGWWNDAWLVFVALSAVALVLVQMRTAGSAAVAEHAVAPR